MAIQPEMAEAILVDQLPNIFQRFVSRQLYELRFLLGRHRGFELSEIPTRLGIKFFGIEWNKDIELDPFRFRVGAEAISSAGNDLNLRED